MFREYSSIKIVNPIAKNNLVKLLGNQRLNISLSLPEYDEAEINVLSDYLILENREENKQSISLVYRSQIPQSLTHLDLFLGELYITSGQIESSLCVVQESPHALNNSLISVVNPNGHTCRIEHFQNLAVMFFKKNIDDYVISHGNYIKFCSQATHHSAYAQSFFFKLDEETLKNIHELPRGRYDSGNIVFKGKDAEYKLNLILNWKAKKASPRNRKIQPTVNIRSRKNVYYNNVYFKRLDDNIEKNCNVIVTGE